MEVGICVPLPVRIVILRLLEEKIVEKKLHSTIGLTAPGRQVLVFCSKAAARPCIDLFSNAFLQEWPRSSSFPTLFCQIL